MYPELEKNLELISYFVHLQLHMFRLLFYFYHAVTASNLNDEIHTRVQSFREGFEFSMKISYKKLNVFLDPKTNSWINSWTWQKLSK